jgi:hypothetical protein
MTLASGERGSESKRAVSAGAGGQTVKTGGRMGAEDMEWRRVAVAEEAVYLRLVFSSLPHPADASASRYAVYELY